MKKLLFLITLFMLMLSVICVDAIFSPKLDSNDIGVSVKFGYGRNIAVSNIWIPVTIDLENKTDDTIEGDIVLNFTEDSTKTSVPFVLPGKVKKSTTLYVFYTGQSMYKVSLLSKRGSVMYETSRYSITNDGNIYSRSNLIGVLTDNTDSLNYILKLENINFEEYLSQLGLPYASIITKADVLNSKNFPVSKEAIGSFAALIINDFDLSSLTSEQKANFDYYIQTGGTVIFGTGLEASYAYAGMDKYVNPNLKETKVERVRLSAKTASVDLNLHITDVEDQNLSQILAIDHTPIAYKHNKFNLYYLTFGFNEPDLLNWAGNYEYIFEFLLDQTSTIKGFNDANYYYNGNNFGSILSFASKNFTPSLLLIVFIVFLYLIVVGPVSYAILKKKDKREFMWVAIPVIVVLFSVTIFVYGYVTRGGGNTSSSLTIVELNPYSELQKPAYVTTAVMTSSNGDYDISLGKEALFGKNIFVNRSYQYGGYNEPSLALSFWQGNKPKVTVKGATMWSFITAEASLDIKNYGSIESEVEVDDAGKITVKLKNNTGHDLENVIITAHDNVKTFSEFKYLDTVEYSFRISTQVSNMYINNVTNAVNSLFGIQNNGYYGSNMYIGQMINELGRDKALKASILNEFLKSRGGAEEFTLSPKLHVAGFVKNPENVNVKINGRNPSKSWDHTLVYQSIDLGNEASRIREDRGYVPTFLPKYSKNVDTVDDLVVLKGKDSYAIYEVIIPENYVFSYQLNLNVKTKDNAPIFITNVDYSLSNYGNKVKGSGFRTPITDLIFNGSSIDNDYMKNPQGQYKFLYFLIEPTEDKSKVVIEDVEYSITPVNKY